MKSPIELAFQMGYFSDLELRTNYTRWGSKNLESATLDGQGLVLRFPNAAAAAGVGWSHRCMSRS